MKRYIRNSIELDPQGREVVGEVSVIFELAFDNIVEAVSNSDLFPGRTQFLKDVKAIISDEFGCDVVYGKESNSDPNDSISIYVVFYCPVDDNSSVRCTALLKVSDHLGSGIYTKDYQVFRKNMSDKYKHPTSFKLQDPVILVSPEIYRHYSKSLDDIRYELDQLIKGWKREYAKKGRI